MTDDRVWELWAQAHPETERGHSDVSLFDFVDLLQKEWLEELAGDRRVHQFTVDGRNYKAVVIREYAEDD